jgi:nitrate reductase cytochrome c-type subunit
MAVKFDLTPRKPFVRRGKNGVSRIVRDSYRGLEWYKTIKEVAARDRACVFCNLPQGAVDPLTGNKVRFETHHMRALSRSGTTEKSNLGYVCEKCHASRHKHLR